MRIPHLPHINWEPVFKLLEKLVVIYKLIEVFETMFSFFSNIKTRVAALEADVKAIYAHIKADFAAKEQVVAAPEVTPDVPVAPTAPVEAPNATEAGK